MMVFHERLSWLRIVLMFRGSVARKIMGRLLVTTLFAMLVTEMYREEKLTEGLTMTPFSLIGVALGIFLGFRNNSGYERFWEGRKLWGKLVNTTRSLTRQVMTLVDAKVEGPAVNEYHRDFVHRIAAYVHALRFHLRGESGRYHELARLLPQDDLEAVANSSNPPIAMIHTMGEKLRDAWQRGWIDTYHLPIVESSLTLLADIQGGCERIKATPIPFSYTLLMHRIVAIYCFALPFGIVQQAHLWTPLVVLLVSYAFYGLDMIGDELEMPFGTDDNDLPLEQLSTMMEVNVRERLGETDLPPLRQPVNNVLL